ncbi:MAG: hypothetical protein KAJ18_09850 [Candidatus Omnitrophica bacterium]|nr:hypothetical protein [Candidatus Omnitrophota bacterium]
MKGQGYKNFSLSNRIKDSWVWLKCFGPILFVHKPLCEKFQQDIVRVKNILLCRGCCFVWAGVFLFCFVLSYWVQVHMVIFLLAGGVVVILSAPKVYARFPRWGRDIIRLGLGVLMAFVGWLILKQYYVSAGGCVFVLLILRATYVLKSRQLSIQTCESCAEYRNMDICSGFAQKKEIMERYEKHLERRLTQK